MNREERLDGLKTNRCEKPPGNKYSLELAENIFDGFFRSLMVPLDKDSIIVDYGCCGEFLWEQFRVRNLKIVGVTGDNDFDRRQNSGNGLKILEGDSAFNFISVFDGFVCMNYLESIRPELWSRKLKGIYRSLKPGAEGLMIISFSDESMARDNYSKLKEMNEPVVPGEYIDNGFYAFRPLKGHLEPWLKNAGFKIVRDRQSGFYSYIIVKK